MAALKTETITVRIEPAVKAGLKAAAQLEHRSIANMVEVLIRDHCARSGIAIGGGDRSAFHPDESLDGRPDATEPQNNKKGKPSR
jgi:hypothetical protein